MEKPILVIKPSAFNALVPLFLRNMLISVFIVAVLFAAGFLLEFWNVLVLPVYTITYSIILVFVLALIPLTLKIIYLFNVTYYFYRTHVESEFKLIHIKKHSVPYAQITNIALEISLWDRLCKAGDITIFTAEDNKENLVLPFIKNPEKIEKSIYFILHQTKK